MQKNTATKELAPIKARINKMQTIVDALVITDEVTQAAAVNMLAGIKDVQRNMQQHKDARIKPINATLALLRADYKPLEEYCKKYEGILKGKMLTYYQEQERIRLEAAAKLAARVKKGTMKPKTAERKIEATPEVKTHVATEQGAAATVKKIKQFKVINLGKVPLDFHLANLPAIRKAMHASQELPGVEYWLEDDISAR